MKLERLDAPPRTPILSYESEEAAYHEQDKETLAWTFRGMRHAQLFNNGDLVATLSPVGFMGLLKYRGSYEGKPVVFRSRANWGELRDDVHIIIDGNQDVGILRTDTFVNPAVYFHNDGKEYLLRKEHVGTQLDWWWFISSDGRKMALTKADFEYTMLRSRYTFRPIDVRANDPSPWLLAVISLYNILRYNFPS